MKTLSPQYAQFTPEERFRLTLAADARGDRPEVQRLMRSCPQIPLVGPDPRFSIRVLGMHDTVSHVINLWVEASAHVLCYGLLVAGLPAEDGALVAKATAEWKTSSAIWRGIEAGITKFCAEVDLTGDQLLVMANGRSAAVEWARGLLHDDARADRRCENATRQKLRHAWEGESGE